jgi:hypothetical protein
MRVVARGDSHSDVDALADTRGQFELPRTSGPRIFRIDPLPNGWWLAGVRARSRDVTNEPIETTGLTDLEIVLSARPVVLRGMVAASDGAIPPDAAVLVFPENSASWGRQSTEVVRAWPDEHGEFEIIGLPPGSYYVIAVAKTPSGFLLRNSAMFTALGTRATLVTVTENGTESVRLELKPQ